MYPPKLDPVATSEKGHCVAGIPRAVRLHAEILLPESYMKVRPNKEAARGWSFRQGQPGDAELAQESMAGSRSDPLRLARSRHQVHRTESRPCLSPLDLHLS